MSADDDHFDMVVRRGHAEGSLYVSDARLCSNPIWASGMMREIGLSPRIWLKSRRVTCAACLGLLSQMRVEEVAP